MKKIWILLMAALLLTLTAGLALASNVNPNQMGYQGNEYQSAWSEVAQSSTQGNNNDDSAYLAGALDANGFLTVDNVAKEGDEDPFQSKPIGWVDPNAALVDPEILGPAPIGGDGDQLIVDNDESGAFPDKDDTPSSSATKTLDWYADGYALINANKSIKIYDIKTGISWSATYINGANHADIIPASVADAQKLINNKITGDYVRRPVLVTIAGTQYAGSMYAVGHGDKSYCNYFKGVMCIHFTGSQTHGTKRVDSDHQNAIQEALKYSDISN